MRKIGVMLLRTAKRFSTFQAFIRWRLNDVRENSIKGHMPLGRYRYRFAVLLAGMLCTAIASGKPAAGENEQTDGATTTPSIDAKSMENFFDREDCMFVNYRKGPHIVYNLPLFLCWQEDELLPRSTYTVSLFLDSSHLGKEIKFTWEHTSSSLTFLGIQQDNGEVWGVLYGLEPLDNSPELVVGTWCASSDARDCFSQW